jgi:aryl-alcohol dehydrogenase-like predicted oxidoreductase
VQLRPVGATGIRLSPIGLGGYELGSDPDHVPAARAAIEAALDSGVNWIDTAEAYSDTANETVIGQAMRGLSTQPVVSSKADPHGDNFRREPLHAACRASLKRLGVDHLDVYVLHWPDEPDGVPLDETWGAMGELVDEGLVRAIGLSNFAREEIEACHTARRVDVIQDGLSLIDHLANRELFRWAAEHDIAVVVYEPLAGGLLGGGPITLDALRRTWGDLEEWSFYDRLCAPGKLERSAAVAAELLEVAARLELPAAQVAVAWVLAQPGVTSALCGSRNPAHVRENSEAADIRLDAETVAELDAAIPLGPAFAG